MKQENTVEAALLALSSVDQDHARARNDVGFNGRDTEFGNSLASQLRAGKTLSYKQAMAGFRMCRTYKTQLERDWGILYDLIPEPVDTRKAENDAKPYRLIVWGSPDSASAKLDTPYNPSLVNDVRGVPGRKWNKEQKVWTVPVDVTTIPMIEAMIETYSMQVEDPEGLLKEVALKSQRMVEASKASSADIHIRGLGGELLPFQAAGVKYLLEAKGGLVGDEMGLGKTVQALALFAEIRNRWRDANGPILDWRFTDRKTRPRLLCIVPAVVKLNWAREARKWLPELRESILVLNGAGGDLIEPDVVILNYDILKKWVEPLMEAGPWTVVVLDESHYIKNRKAQRTEHAKRIIKEAEYKVLLTGTPVLNRPNELVTQLDALGKIKAFGGAYAFLNRYCIGERSSWGSSYDGAHHLDELHQRLRSTCYIRRTKEDVLTELPAKRRVTVPVDLNDRKGYEDIEADLKRWFAEQAENDTDFQAILDGMDEEEAQAATKEYIHSKDVRSRAAEALVRIEACKQAAVTRKMDSIHAWIENFLESGKKLVVFAHHKKVVDAISERFKAPSITGSTPVEQRQANVDRFQSDPECRIIVGNMQAAGVGITLHAASDVAFVELPWRPGDLDQAEDRCHRIGQTDSVTAWYLLAESTIEETIGGLLDDKRAVVEQVQDGRARDTSGGLIRGLAMALGRKDARVDEDYGVNEPEPEGPAWQYQD